MIITLAGRRTDPQEAPIARFPLGRSAAVRERIYTLLKEQQATALVSAAACGADLLALAAAGELGIRRRIILPFTPAHFRAASVMDRPGDWGALFDQVIAKVQAAGDLVLLNAEKEDQATFLWTNEMILDEAQKLASQEASATGGLPQNALLAVIVWEGQPRSVDDVTAHFANEARARSIPVTEILTL